MILVDNYEQMTARPELGCNLECVKEDLASDNVHEYCGPVKIVVVETPKQEYLLKAWGAAFLAFANMLIGGMCLLILLREAAHGKDNPDSISSMHIVLCTLGLLFYSAFGMMNMMSIYGPSSPLKKTHRLREHMLFHTFGLLFGFGGGVFFMSGAADLDFTSMHTATCLIGLFCGGISLVTGCVFSRILGPMKVTTAVHVLTGYIAFCFYYFCFLSSLDYTYIRRFLLNMAKSSGRASYYVCSLFLLATVGVACAAYCLLLFKRQRKATCKTIAENKEMEKAMKKASKLAKKEAD